MIKAIFLYLQVRIDIFMANNHDKQTFWQRYKSKYRLTVLNDTTLEEVYWMRLSRMNIVGILGVSAIIFAVFLFFLIAYTPIKEFIPGFPDGETHKNIIRNVYRLDSLEHELKLNEQYINNLKTILNGETPKNYLAKNDKIDSTNMSVDSISLSITKKDSLFRVKIEQENEFDLLSANINIEDDINLFVPMQGIITNKYNSNQKHFGVDIVSKKSKDVFSCYRGTVISASWTLETGYVVQIQHPKNLLSVYKHLEIINVKQGDVVGIGKRIGKVGDVGTLSTGPHLHLEIWKNGKSINPSKLINFN